MLDSPRTNAPGFSGGFAQYQADQVQRAERSGRTDWGTPIYRAPAPAPSPAPVASGGRPGGTGGLPGSAPRAGRGTDTPPTGFPPELWDTLDPATKAMILAEADEQDAAAPDPVIGSPFEDGRGFGASWFKERNRYLPEADRISSPNYRESDVVRQWQRLPLAERARAVEYMRQLGFVASTDTTWNAGIADGIRAAMSYANAAGTSWTGALRSLARQAGRIEKEQNAEARQKIIDQFNFAKENYLDEPYLAPDYDLVANSVRDLFAQRLGRRPKDWEMELLADKFTEAHRARWEQQARIDEQMFLRNAAIEAEVGLQSIGDDTTLDKPEEIEGGVEEDPYQSLRAEFEKRYAQEEDDNEAEATSASIDATVENASSLLMRMVMGG